jgi:hypothetical protein
MAHKQKAGSWNFGASDMLIGLPSNKKNAAVSGSKEWAETLLIGCFSRSYVNFYSLILVFQRSMGSQTRVMAEYLTGPTTFKRINIWQPLFSYMAWSEMTGSVSIFKR